MKIRRGGSRLEIIMMVCVIMLGVLAFTQSARACTETDPDCAPAPDAAVGDFVLARSLERPVMPSSPHHAYRHPVFDWDPFHIPKTAAEAAALTGQAAT